MSDAKLRGLERRWLETGSLDDEAALVLERLRAGHVTIEQVERAASANYPAARKALGRPPERELNDEDVIDRLYRWVHEAADETVLRLWAADCAERWLRHFEARHPSDTSAREALARARQFAMGQATIDEMRAAGLRVFAAAQQDAKQLRHDPSAAAAASAAMGAWAACVEEPFGVRAAISDEPWADFDMAERRWQLARLAARTLHSPTYLPEIQ